jgi:hypothetical protein
VHSREVTLGDGDSTVQTLDDLGQSIADLGLLLERILEEGKDGRIENGGFGRHD